MKSATTSACSISRYLLTASLLYLFSIPTVHGEGRTLLTDNGEVVKVRAADESRHFFPLDEDRLSPKASVDNQILAHSPFPQFGAFPPPPHLLRRQQRTEPEAGSGKDSKGNTQCYSPQSVACDGGCCKDSEWCYEGGCCARSLNGCDGITCYDPLKYICCKGGYQCFLGKDCCAEGCCDFGWKCCDSGRCCPNNGECCKGGGCCNDGKKCVIDLRSGERGCYIGDLKEGGDAGPNPGKEVTVTVNPPIAVPPTTVIITRTEVPDAPTHTPNPAHSQRFCRNAGYILCPESSFCCPPSSYCFLDRTGTQKCNPDSTYIFSYFYPWQHGTTTAWYLGSTTYTLSAARVTGPIGNLWQETQVQLATPTVFSPPTNPEALIRDPPRELDADECDERCFPVSTLGEEESRIKTVTVVQSPPMPTNTGGSAAGRAGPMRWMVAVAVAGAVGAVLMLV